MALLVVERLHYAVLLPAVEQCIERVASRTGHGFTDEPAARHMHRQFAQASIDQRHVLADPPGPAEETAQDILERTRSGRCATHDGRESPSST
jgi:hypothetical protein